MTQAASGADPFSLSDLPAGQSAVVERLEMDGEQRRRLLDLGLIPGTVVSAEFSSPLGDPTAYRVRGALIALRRAQAQHIIVARMPGHD